MRKLVAIFLALAVPAFLNLDRLAVHSLNDLAKAAHAVLATTSGRIQLEGLSKPVRVLRDSWGVAHIFAETVEDLFFAQGFVAAQDRLWQMEIWRRTGEGKLAEILGPSALERDKFARLMRYRGDMEAEWKSYAPDARRIIESFVRGVNAFIETHRGRWPIEFQLTGTQPEQWTPEVCLTRMAGYVMTRNASSEVLRAELVYHVGADRAAELLETDPPKRLEIPAGLDLRDIDHRILSGASAASAPASFRSDEGSNNWVVGGALTATGKPILANDPHRSIALPSLRYMVHLVAPGWNVIGAGEPALPGVAVGHNERIGFGLTIFGIDQQDLYVEETHPEDPVQYRYQGRWEKMTIEKEKIKVKGKAEPVEVELHFTRHGPVIYEDRGRHRAYALRWVGGESGSAGYLASLSLDRARNWPEFLAAAERWKAPAENIVYADVDGNIGWQAAGLAPIRRGWSGLLPVPGGSGSYEWDGFLPLSELPRSYNPSSHFIATANHKVIPEGYRHEIGFEWTVPFRFRRIDEVLQAGKRFTVADFERLQHDEVSLPAREIVPLLNGIRIEDETLRPAADRLLTWDRVLSKDSAPAALYEVWITKLVPNIFRSQLPAEVWSHMSGRAPSLTTVIKWLKNPDRKRFGSNPEAKRDQVLIESLKEAVGDVRARLGTDMKTWRWGALHVAEFKHALSTNDVRRALFDLKPVPRGGDGYTVNATGGQNLHQTSGASYRQIFDLSDWDNSVAINVPGQSGQPGSRHYADLLPLWAEGKYVPLLFSRDKIEQHAKERLILEPKGR